MTTIYRSSAAIAGRIWTEGEGKTECAYYLICIMAFTVHNIYQAEIVRSKIDLNIYHLTYLIL